MEETSLLTYTFDDIGDSPLYEYLYRRIRDDIVSGVLRAEDRLPSKRSFAKNLGVSTITVENAYGQLIDEGYIYSIPKKGYFVSNISGIARWKQTTAVSGIRQEPQKPQFIEDFSSNQTKADRFPFSIWAKLLRETISEKSRELMTNSPGTGVLPLRRAIAGHLRSFRGMEVDPGQIVVGAGTEYLYGLLIQLLGREKIYCVEDPGYQKIAQIYKSNGSRCRYAEMDGEGISIRGIRECDADIVHISPTHHFPTGITMPVNRRYELLAWADESDGRCIIEDDYDSEFRLSGRPIPPLQSIDTAEKVIYMNTFSKSLASTIRISYMVLPVRLVNRFYDTMSFYSCTVSNFEQYTLARFIEEGYLEKHINRMRLFYSRQRERVMDAIEASALNELCAIVEKDSGLHFLLKLRTELTDSELTERLRQKRINLTPLEAYYRNREKAPAHTFIFNYSNLNPETLPQALDMIAECLRS